MSQNMRLKPLSILFLMACPLAFSAHAAEPGPSDQCRFIGIRTFGGFNVGISSNANETVLMSPVFKAPIGWDELVVSWNAATPSNSWLQIEVMGIYPDHSTKYYTLGVWAPGSPQTPRGSFGGQVDADGRVNTDTLVMNRAGADVQLRLTMAGPNATLRPQLKFLGLSFLDNRVQLAAAAPNRAAWGKIINTPSNRNIPIRRNRAGAARLRSTWY